jgi:hypothetical protein
MEKLTVSQIVKTKPAKYGFTTMVKTKEHGNTRIYMINTKEEDSIKVDRVYEGETSLWKKGDDVEFWAFHWPKKEDKIGKQLEELNNRVVKIQMMVEKIGLHLMPPTNKVAGTDIDYPEPTHTSEEITFDPFDPDDGLDQLTEEMR